MTTIDHTAFETALKAYKESFSDNWELEKFKWEAVECFQNNWDIEAEDFGKMFEQATAKCKNLLAAKQFLPRTMIMEFAQADPEAVREMFRRLYDESRALDRRAAEFMESSENIRVKYDTGAWKHAYQTVNVVSTYLWLKYPDKYYIYKYRVYKTAAEYLKSDYAPRPNESLPRAYEFYDSIRKLLFADPELKTMLNDINRYYPDNELRTLTGDFGFFISSKYSPKFSIAGKSPAEPQPALRKPAEIAEPYDDARFLSEVYMSKNDLNTLRDLLEHKRNLILQGAPGVGKTYAAKRLAYTMMKCMDKQRIATVQFHQNYSYEDLIMGYRPTENGFELRKGIFHRFCTRAANDPGNAYFFIIDEINRGNMGKIFGELLMLIEREYRGTRTALAYSGEQFYVPENLYIIGMMNTADRSLAMIDYALRRRFAFFDMQPAFDNESFKNYLGTIGNDKLNRIVETVKSLNREIADDDSLGSGFMIGHSYFCNLSAEGDIDSRLTQTVRYDIIPTLREYWFDDKQKVDKWQTALIGALHD